MASYSSPIDWANMGALTPPVVPVNDPGKQQKAFKALAIIALTLPTMFVGLRFWTKLRISKDMGWDDCKHIHLRMTWKYVNFV